MKKLLSLVLALALVLSFTAFAAADEPAKITVFHYMVEGNKQAGLEAVEEAFKAANPDLNVELRTSPIPRAPTTGRSWRPRSLRATTPKSSWATRACTPR